MTAKRQEIMERFRQQIARGNNIVGAGAGSGLSAKSSQQGGVDLLVVYNSGYYRMAGKSSLAGLMPYGDANAITLKIGAEVLSAVNGTPVLAGVCGTDPFRSMRMFLKTIRDMGFSGVQNFPTVGLIDGLFRQNLEETGIGYALEVDLIRLAHEMDLLTTPYAFNPENAIEMTRAGADIIVAHMGLTTRGSIGAKTHLSLDDCVRKIQDIHDAAKNENPDVLVLCHGGPLAEPEDIRLVLGKTAGLAGFYGASSVERLPTERAIAEQIRAFKSIPVT